MNNRRHFLKTTGLSLLPTIASGTSILASDFSEKKFSSPPVVRLYGDSDVIEPIDYLKKLQVYNTSISIQTDRYGEGGTIADLEKRFEQITGKERAIYLPTGTMANQLALAVLSGEKTKVFVQETSHVYRDEADAAQSVFQKRLIPLAPDQPYFTLEQLQNAIENLDHEEAFASGIGAVSIENPVRRSDGRIVPINEIKKISAYCRRHNIKLHLDGARIYIASTWSGIPVKEYASYFDTVYISLYKYLGAMGGAILCGPKAVVERIPHLIKVHGGTMYSNWVNAAMSLNRLESIEQSFRDCRDRANKIFGELNEIEGIKVSHLPEGSNIYSLALGKQIDGERFRNALFDNYKILMRQPNENNQVKVSVNETILYQDAIDVINAFTKCL